MATVTQLEVARNAALKPTGGINLTEPLKSLTAQRVPHPLVIAFAFALKGQPGEKFPAKLEFRTPSGKAHLEINMNMVLDAQGVSEMCVTAPTGFTLPEFGEYALLLLANGKVIGSTPFTLVRAVH